MDETSIADLLGNPQFKTNITIGKVLKIVRALIDGNKASAAIAKQYEVEQAIVDLIKIHVIK